MENVPVSLDGLRENYWTIEKKLLILKFTSLSACIVGTAVYLRPVEPYFGAEIFGILVPAFIAGYIVVNTSEILAMHMEYQHNFLEVCFAAIGAFFSGICSIYQMYKWIEWIVDIYGDYDGDYDIQELVLALACLISSIALIFVIVCRAIEKRRLSVEEE